MQLKKTAILFGSLFRGIVIGFLIITFLKFHNSEPERSPYPMDCTSADARRHQSWICDVEVRQGGEKKEVPLEEAWVEAATENKHFLVWFPYQKRLDYNFLCFRYPASQEVAYRFTLEGHNQDRNVIGTLIDGHTEFVCFAKTSSDNLHPQPTIAQYTTYPGGRIGETGNITFVPIRPK
jgi:hypothetical protein